VHKHLGSLEDKQMEGIQVIGENIPQVIQSSFNKYTRLERVVKKSSCKVGRLMGLVTPEKGRREVGRDVKDRFSRHSSL